jgi:hypothetical protein
MIQKQEFHVTSYISSIPLSEYSLLLLSKDRNDAFLNSGYNYLLSITPVFYFVISPSVPP